MSNKFTGGFLRDLTRALVVSSLVEGSKMRNGFLRGPEGELIVTPDLPPSVVSGSPTGGIPAWVTGTDYSLNTLVTNGGSTWINKEAHKSGATFEADEAKWQSIGSGGEVTKAELEAAEAEIAERALLTEIAAVDTDGALAADSDERVASQKATKTYTDAAVAGFGFPASVNLSNVRGGGSDKLSVGTSNNCIFLRCRDGGTISKIGLEIIASAGNISVAAYRNTGSGRAAKPGERLATSGAIACPETGFREISLGKSITLNPGDWLAISADGTGATFSSMLTSASNSGLGAGVQWVEAEQHPAPETPTSLFATLGHTIILIGCV